MGICEAIYDRWMGEEQRKKIEFILSHIEPRGKILDVGAGSGLLSKYLPTVSIDISPEVFGAEGPKLLASGTALPFKPSSFDWVFCIDAFHLIGSSEELVRVLKPGGTLVLSQFCSKYDVQQTLKKLEDSLPNCRVSERLFYSGVENEVVVIAEKL